LAKCSDCGQKNITKAYRVLCEECATKKRDVPMLKEGENMTELLQNMGLTTIEEGETLPESVL
jgi:Zn finger protein HypA/HybF involved in hydrogenase expression